AESPSNDPDTLAGCGESEGLIRGLPGSERPVLKGRCQPAARLRAIVAQNGGKSRALDSNRDLVGLWLDHHLDAGRLETFESAGHDLAGSGLLLSGWPGQHEHPVVAGGQTRDTFKASQTIARVRLNLALGAARAVERLKRHQALGQFGGRLAVAEADHT